MANVPLNHGPVFNGYINPLNALAKLPLLCFIAWYIKKLDPFIPVFVVCVFL